MRFGEIYSQNRRKVVIHHTHLVPNIMDYLKPDDLVFFDDCLFSQYVFIKDNISNLKNKNIVCVLGCSPKAVRPNGATGWYDVESKTLHDEMNLEVVDAASNTTGKYINGFMSKNEIDELLVNDNVFLALHGCCHLKLETCKDKFAQISKFEGDLASGIKLFDEFGYKTDIFVYPYAYEPFLGNIILKRHGFRYVFAGTNSKRISLESLT